MTETRTRKFKATRHNPGPPKSVTWEEYRAEVSSAWEALLDSDPDEPTVHAFLEQHPCLLPETYGLYQVGHHGVVDGVIYSKPELPGTRIFIPDFMYLALDSANVTAVLIEIERPGKAHATKEGLVAQPLNQARAQIEDWKTWFQDPENATLFQRAYSIPRSLFSTRGFQTRFILIYGRREDAESNARFAKTRGNPKDHTEMTFDRLAPTERNAGVPTARLDRSEPGQTKLRLVAVSPMANELAFDYLDPTRVLGVEEVLSAQVQLSPERRAFLQKCAKRPVKT